MLDGEEIHREVHALEIAAFDRQVARQRGAGADDGGVEILDQQLRLDVLADGGIAQELDAFLLQQRDAARDHFALVELHVGDAVGQQAARAIRALEHGHRVAGLVELRRGGEARRAGADDRDLLAGARTSAVRQRSSLRPSPCRRWRSRCS